METVKSSTHTSCPLTNCYLLYLLVVLLDPGEAKHFRFLGVEVKRKAMVGLLFVELAAGSHDDTKVTFVL